MTLHQAREPALEVFLRVRRGEDPAGDRQAALKAPSMTDLADRHVREHSEVKKKPKNAKRDRNAWDRLILPKLGHRKVRDIIRADIAKLMTGLTDTPAMANKVLSLLSKAFNLAEHREADIQDVRIHDLRHTYASYGVNGGQSLAMVGKLLGHRKVQTTMRYTHLADDPLRQAAESIGAELTAGLEGAEAGEVVELSGQRKAS